MLYYNSNIIYKLYTTLCMQREIDLCQKCHPSTKWLARVHDVVVFKTKVLHFKIENTPIKTQI